MKTPPAVLISGERHLIVHGQFGNLQAKINQLEHMIKASEMLELLPYLAEVDEELTHLVKIYPSLGGDVDEASPKTAFFVPGREQPKPDCTEMKRKLTSALRDMRVLMDAAALSFKHEGDIDCGLRVMLDEAWHRGADIVGINGIDDIPF